MRADPYFSDIPWEIITDEKGKVIGVVYLLYASPTRFTKRRNKKSRREKV